MNAFTSDFSWLQLAAGFGLAALISLAAYAARSLSLSGAIAATLLGTAVFGLGGLPGLFCSSVFFLIVGSSRGCSSGARRG